MEKISINLIFCLSVLWTATLPAMAGLDRWSKELVLSEYPKALAKLEAKFANCSGQGVHTTTMFAPDGSRKAGGTSNLDFALSGDRGRLAFTASDPKAFEARAKSTAKTKAVYQTVCCFNERNSFFLVKNTPNSDYLIKWIDDDPGLGRRDILELHGHAIRCPVMIHMILASRFLALPRIEITRVAEVPQAGRPTRLRIDFKRPRSPKIDPKASTIDEGWLVVSPDEGWILYEYGTVLASPTSLTTTRIGRITYSSEIDGGPAPLSSEARSYLGSLTADPIDSDWPPNPTAREEFRFTKFRFGSTPDREFTLSAFGLPEFGQPAVPRRSYSVAWWIFGAAMVSLAVAVGLRWYANRPRAEPGRPGA